MVATNQGGTQSNKDTVGEYPGLWRGEDQCRVSRTKAQALENEPMK